MVSDMVPASLLAPEVEVVWARVRERLERVGPDRRGRLSMDGVAKPALRILGDLVGRPVGATIDLGLLEAGLQRVGVADDLVTAMERLGFPVSPDRELGRAQRRAADEARAALRLAASNWDVDWAPAWADEVIRAGLARALSSDDAVWLVATVERVLAAISAMEGLPGLVSRVDLAAQVLGDSHALDEGTRVGSAVVRALRISGAVSLSSAVWEAAGVHTDLVSGPALVWNLPAGLVDAACPLGKVVAGARAMGAPVHLSQMMLRQWEPWEGGSGADVCDVLVTENPRIVEAAAQRLVPFCVMTTNGNPSGAVRLLLRRLQRAGVRAHYHGDFDAAGLAICARMERLACVPWRMRTKDYLSAVTAAAEEGVVLPVDPDNARFTPWDPSLQMAFNASRLVVHEERLIDSLLDGGGVSLGR